MVPWRVLDFVSSGALRRRLPRGTRRIDGIPVVRHPPADQLFDELCHGPIYGPGAKRERFI